MSEVLVDGFETTAARHADRLAVKTCRYVWTWRQLDTRATAIARQLLANGADRRTPVALVMETDAPLLAAMMGVLKAGLFLVVIDPTHPQERNRWIVEDSQAKFALVDEASREFARELNGCWQIVSSPNLAADRASPDGKPFHAPWPRSPDDLCCLIYTSGSTGRPKGVMCGNRLLTSYGRAVRDPLQAGCEDRLTLLHSPSVAGAWRHIAAAALSGACLFPYRIAQQGLPGLSNLLRRERITILHCIASVMRHFDESLAPDVRFPEMRAVVFGGERVWRRDVAAARRRAGPGASMLLGLGSSEAGTISNYLLASDVPLNDELAPIGRPLPDKRVAIVDEYGRPAPPGQIGELVVSGGTLSAGYWRQPDGTALAFLDDPDSPGDRRFRTGDLAWIAPDGLLYHAGRRDFQVKVRGFRIDVGEIEAALACHPGVRDCVVLAHPDERGEEALAAYLALRPGCEFAPGELREHLRVRLPAHMIPTWFEHPAPWPLTPGGKVDRRALPPPNVDRSPASQRQAEIDRAGNSPDDLEARLLDFWRQVLGRPDAGLHDEFFALGGHSLKAAQLFSKIQDAFGHAPPLSILTQGATVARLAAFLRTDQDHTSTPFLHDLKSSGSRPALFLVHGIGGEVLSFEPLVRHLEPEQPLIGIQASRFMSNGAAVPMVRDMAQQYVAAVRERQPQGPYYLAGYSAGGPIAHEMAQQLLSQGQSVALLAIVDAIVGRPSRWSLAAAGRFLVNLYWLIRDDFRHSDVTSLYRRAKRKVSALARRRESGLPTLNPLPSRIGGYFDVAALPPRWRQFMEEHDRVQQAHQPGNYSGRVTLIRCRARGLFSDHRPDLGWAEVVEGGISIRRVPGNHDSIVREPDVRHLAQALTASLHDARERSAEISAAELVCVSY